MYIIILLAIKLITHQTFQKPKSQIINEYNLQEAPFFPPFPINKLNIESLNAQPK
jgi:hypothetical protein